MLFYPLIEFLSDIRIISGHNYYCSYQSQMHISTHKLYLRGVTNSNCQICVTSKASGGEGVAGRVRVLGVGVTQQPTTAAIPMFSNLNHQARLASIKHGFKVAPKLFLAQQFIGKKIVFDS